MYAPRGQDEETRERQGGEDQAAPISSRHPSIIELHQKGPTILLPPPPEAFRGVELKLFAEFDQWAAANDLLTARTLPGVRRQAGTLSHARAAWWAGWAETRGEERHMAPRIPSLRPWSSTNLCFKSHLLV